MIGEKRGGGVFLASLLFLAPLLGIVGCGDVPIESAPSAPQAPVVLTAQVDKAEVAIAETLHYSITLEHAPGLSPAMPEVFPKLQGFLVSDIQKEGPLSRDGRMRTTHTFTLQGLDAGSYILPAVSVNYQDETGETHTVGAPQIFVEVKAAPTDPNATPSDIEDIKALEIPPPDYRRVQLLAAGVASVLLLAGLAYWLWKRRHRLKTPPPPPPPPWVVALEALKLLQAEDLLSRGDARAWSFRLSEILRRYLEDRYHVPAMETSTEELLVRFRQGAIPAGKLQELARRVLTGTDRAKFAKQPLTTGEGETLLQATRELVEATIPPPPSPDEQREAP